MDNHSNIGWTSVSLTDNLIHSHEFLVLPKSNVGKKLAGQTGRTVRIVGSDANIVILNEPYSGLDSPGIYPNQYAKVEGIFHGYVVPQAGSHTEETGMSQRIDFLWVRWLISKGQSMGTKDLDLLNLPPLSDSNCFGFIDPQSVAQASHLVPKFSKAIPECPGNDYHPIMAPQRRTCETNAFFLNPFVSLSISATSCSLHQEIH